MFAIVSLCGKQYRVQEKDLLRVEKVGLPEGKSSSTNSVLLISDGKRIKIGTPYVDGAAVEFKVVKNGRGEKVRIFKMKAKKRYKRLKGHRQPFSEVEVMRIHV